MAVLLVISPASAEQSKFNLSLEPAIGGGLNLSTFASGGWLKLDTLAFGLGAIAPSIEIFGIGSQNATYLASGVAYGAGLGLRLRLFNPDREETGNLWGHLWIDAHLIVAHGGLGLGFDANAGYAFSLVDGLQVGPFVKLVWLGPHRLLLGGLCISVGFPMHPPALRVPLATKSQQAAQALGR